MIPMPIDWQEAGLSNINIVVKFHRVVEPLLLE